MSIIRTGGDRARVLTRSAPHLPEDLLWEAVVAAQAIEQEWDQAAVLADLTPRLAELGYPEEALATAQAIEGEGDRARALTGLAPHLPEDLLREALAAALAIEGEGNRARALTGLAPYLPEGLREAALRETLVALVVAQSFHLPPACDVTGRLAAPGARGAHPSSS